MRSVTFVDRLTLEVPVDSLKWPAFILHVGWGHCCTEWHLSWWCQWRWESRTDHRQRGWRAFYLQGDEKKTFSFPNYNASYFQGSRVMPWLRCTDLGFITAIGVGDLLGLGHRLEQLEPVWEFQSHSLQCVGGCIWVWMAEHFWPLWRTVTSGRRTTKAYTTSAYTASSCQCEGPDSVWCDWKRSDWAGGEPHRPSG